MGDNIYFFNTTSPLCYKDVYYFFNRIYVIKYRFNMYILNYIFDNIIWVIISSIINISLNR